MSSLKTNWTLGDVGNVERINNIAVAVNNLSQRVDQIVAQGVGGGAAPADTRTLMWDGSDYQPASLRQDTSAPRLFRGSRDPNTVSTVVLTRYDEWVQLPEQDDGGGSGDPGGGGGDDGGSSDPGPPEGGYGAEPTASNTGPDPEVTLTTHTGDLLATESVSGLHITGHLYLCADGVTATDCQVDGSVFFSENQNKSYVNPPYKNQGLTRVWCKGAWTTGCDGLTMESCRIGPSQDTDMQLTAYDPSSESAPYVHADNITVSNCYFHPPIASTGTRHLQAVHLMGTRHVVFENCTFDYVTPDHDTQTQTTAAFFVQAYPQQSEDVTLRHCYFYGGGYYQISIDSTPDMTVADCKFHSFTGTGGGNGAIQYPPKAGAPQVSASDNTLDGDPYTWIQPSS